VTPEMLERVQGNIVKRANAFFVEVFGCCVTSQAPQNGCLGIQ
jgi:hypothetical protein